MQDALSLHDDVIYREMMSHPAIFSHPHPKNVALIDHNDQGILQEIIKHSNISNISVISKNISTLDIRVKIHTDLESWLSSNTTAYDLIITTEDATPDNFKTFFNLLSSDGLLVQKAGSTFHLSSLKTLQQDFSNAGFSDIHFLSFPQPHFTSGWRTSIVAKKSGPLKRIREKDIFNKTFSTRYYNFDVHKASLVLPEFMREELEPAIE